MATEKTVKTATTPANTATPAAPEFPVIKTKFEAYTGSEPFLFVSYSHRDTEKVYHILDLLYDHKYRIWYDESCETGNDFRDELRHKIEKCDAVILFVSAASMSSSSHARTTSASTPSTWTTPRFRPHSRSFWPTLTTAPSPIFPSCSRRSSATCRPRRWTV